MIKIRFHGRGGQGAVTAAELVAVAAGYKGWCSQSFPLFGVERRGAPVQAFCRVDKKQIRIHQSVEKPDIVVVLDSTLIQNVDISKGLRKPGLIIINSKKAPEKFEEFKEHKVVTVDADRIANETLGVPIVNTAILGVFAGLVEWCDIISLEKAIKHRFEGKLADKNINALRQCAKEVNK